MKCLLTRKKLKSQKLQHKRKNAVNRKKAPAAADVL